MHGICPGRSFLRRAITLLTIAKIPNASPHLSQYRSQHALEEKKLPVAEMGHQHSLAMALLILPSHQMLQAHRIVHVVHGMVRYGSKWFQLQWVGHLRTGKAQVTSCISLLELIPIIIATIVWGSSFSGKRSSS